MSVVSTLRIIVAESNKARSAAPPRSNEYYWSFAEHPETVNAFRTVTNDPEYT